MATRQGKPWGDRRFGMVFNGREYDRMEWLPEVHGNRYGHDVVLVGGLQACWLLFRGWWRLWLSGEEPYRGLLWVRISLWRRGLVRTPWPFGDKRRLAPKNPKTRKIGTESRSKQMTVTYEQADFPDPPEARTG